MTGNAVTCIVLATNDSPIVDRTQSSPAIDCLCFDWMLGSTSLKDGNARPGNSCAGREHLRFLRGAPDLSQARAPPRPVSSTSVGSIRQGAAVSSSGLQPTTDAVDITATVGRHLLRSRRC